MICTTLGISQALCCSIKVNWLKEKLLGKHRSSFKDQMEELQWAMLEKVLEKCKGISDHRRAGSGCSPSWIIASCVPKPPAVPIRYGTELHFSSKVCALINRGCMQEVGERLRKRSVTESKMGPCRSLRPHTWMACLHFLTVTFKEVTCIIPWREGINKRIKILEEIQFWLNDFPPCKTVPLPDNLWTVLIGIVLEIQGIPLFDFCLSYWDISCSSGHNAALKEMEEKTWGDALSPSEHPITLISIKNELLNDFLFLAHDKFKLTLIVINN